MIGQLVEDACNLHPVELRSRLEAVVRKRLVLRHVLTLSRIAHSASLQEWELASANDARYPSLPQGVLYQLKTEAEEGHLLDAALNDEEDYFEFPRENEPYYTDQKTASAHLADDMSSGAAARAKDESKVGRNSPCPCGSGRKFKKCCGR